MINNNNNIIIIISMFSFTNENKRVKDVGNETLI